MSEDQKQNIIDIKSMAPFISARIAEIIKKLMEAEIEEEILKIRPNIVFDDMDITEKLMILEYEGKSENERQKDKKEAIPFEDILMEEGLTYNDLQD